MRRQAASSPSPFFPLTRDTFKVHYVPTYLGRCLPRSLLVSPPSINRLPINSEIRRGPDGSDHQGAGSMVILIAPKLDRTVVEMDVFVNL